MALLYYSGFETLPPGDGQPYLENISAQGWSTYYPNPVRFPEYSQGVRQGRYTGGQCLVMAAGTGTNVYANRTLVGSEALTFAGSLAKGGFTLGYAARNQATATVSTNSSSFGLSVVTNPSTVTSSVSVANLANRYRLELPSGTARTAVEVAATVVPGTWYYYEIVVTAVTTSSYNLQFYRDSTLLYDSGTININIASHSQPLSLSYRYYTGVAPLASNCCDYMFDDIYLIDRSGPHASVPKLGEVREYRVGPTSDVQAQWSKQGSAASNALTVNKLDYKDNTSYVYSQTAGNTDVYSAPGTVDLPTGGKVVAVAVETFASRGLQARTIQTSIVSGSSRSDSPNIALPTATSYVKHFTTTDPDTGAEWTIEAANTANLRTTLVS